MERLRIAYEIPEQIGTEVHVAVDGSYAGHILIAVRAASTGLP